MFRNPDEEFIRVFLQHYVDLPFDGNSIPFETTNNGTAWNNSPLTGWTAGFMPGILWSLSKTLPRNHIYIQKIVDNAENMTRALESRKHVTSTHDIGVIVLSSFGKGVYL